MTPTNRKVTVLYNQTLATYMVSSVDNKQFMARLISFPKQVSEQPPQHINFIKEGRRFTGDCKEYALLKDLYKNYRGFISGYALHL